MDLNLWAKAGYWVFLIGLIIAFPGALGTAIVLTDKNETGLLPWVIIMVLGLLVTVAGIYWLVKQLREGNE